MRLGALSVRALEPHDHDWVAATLEAEWGSVLVARRGELLDASSFPGYVALADGDRVGLVIVAVRGEEYEILSFSSAVSGHGIGRVLMQRCFKDARANNCRRVWLTTTNNNVPAIGFYQCMGMRLCAVHLDAVATARRMKPSIPVRDDAGIPICDELEFELILSSD